MVHFASKAGLALGCDGLRVGLEDNILYGKDAEGNKIIATNKMLVERAVALAKLAGREIALRDTGDWFAELWQDRPAMPKDPVYALEHAYTGMSVSDKLSAIRSVL